MNITALTHQAEFMMDQHPFTCLTGGFGCGKSFAVGLRCLYLSYMNQGYPGMLITRSGGQLYDLQGEVEKVFSACGFTFLDWNTYKKTDTPLTFTLFDGRIYFVRWSANLVSEIYCHTAENRAYTRWAGGNRAWAVIDELDTMQDPAEVWKFAGHRVRIGPFNNISCASTPEGYGFLWDFFENQVKLDPSKTDRHLIRGCTFDNPYVNLDYVKRQIETHDPASLMAYVYGHFVNLEGHLVYWAFDKDKNSSTRTLDSFHQDTICHLGFDSNKNINATSVTCQDEFGTFHTVHEFYGAKDAHHLIEMIDDTLHGRPIIIYPDASAYEAIRQFERHYGEASVVYTPANPSIVKTVHNLNLNFAEHRWKVNPNTAPRTFIGLLRHTKDASGLPEKKSGLDHGNDGMRYKAFHLSPMEENQNTATIISGAR